MPLQETSGIMKGLPFPERPDRFTRDPDPVITHCIVTLNGCSSAVSNEIYIVITGIDPDQQLMLT